MTFGSKMSHPSSKARISALEKLKQSNAAKLELETRKMEERIRSLKEKMTKEKEERERLGGSRWTSGRTGPLTKNVQKSQGSKKNHANGTVNKVTRKIKILTDEPVDNYIRRPRPVPHENRIKLCGQCEKNVSEWLCHECSEKYCDACFNQFHLRGALRKHTKIKVGAETAQECKKQTNSPITVRQENSLSKSYGATTDARTLTNANMKGPSLLSGSYDEEESANSFAQALQEWRNQSQISKISPRNHPVCTDTSCGTSNGSITDQDDKKELTIKFNSSISYGDRLYLKKNRENRLKLLQSSLQSAESEINESEKKGTKEANNIDISCNNRGSDIQHEEKENNEPVDKFAPNYKEMIQNITAVKSNPEISSQKNIPSRRAVSVQEVSPGEFNIQDDQGTTCIVEECEDATTIQSGPTSSRGAVTICEMYSSNDSKQVLTKDLEQTTDLDTHNYVSPSITSKPFFLKPTGKVGVKKQPVRTMSAGRKKTPNKDEQRKILINKEQQSPQMSSKKNKHDKELPSHQVVHQQSTKPSKQVPLSKSKEKKESSLSSHRSPRPLSNKSSTKSKTRVPIRHAWKPKPTHKELSEFFLAGVDEGSENLQQCEGVYSERSSSTPITNLGRGCLSSTWNPVESYPQISPDSIDMSVGMEIGISTPEKQDYQTTASSAERFSGRVAEMNNSDDLRLTNHKIEELEELPQSWVFRENEKKNSSNEEDELLELTALDDYGTGDQDDDDLATLNDLAWELASSTGGRLTRCEEDFHPDSDDDSIEDMDGGSGLSTPCTLEKSATFRESIMDDFEEMERKFMEEEF